MLAVSIKKRKGVRKHNCILSNYDYSQIGENIMFTEKEKNQILSSYKSTSVLHAIVSTLFEHENGVNRHELIKQVAYKTGRAFDKKAIVTCNTYLADMLNPKYFMLHKVRLAKDSNNTLTIVSLHPKNGDAIMPTDNKTKTAIAALYNAIALGNAANAKKVYSMANNKKEKKASMAS